MSCEEIKKLLTKYVQHTADEEEIKKVEEHLCVCHDCRTSLGSLMDKLDESEENKSAENKKGQEKDEDDFEIISSEAPPTSNLEEAATTETEKKEETPKKEADDKEMEYFPADDIKTFSEKTPEIKESVKEEEDDQGPEKKEESQEDKDEGEASQDDDLDKGLKPAQKNINNFSSDLPPLEDSKTDLIGYVSVGVGALVLIILIFLLIQG